MKDYTEKTCPDCGQRLRFPKNIGGILMSCPSCGKKFHSDFKLGGARKNTGMRGLLISIFELPSKLTNAIGQFFSSK